MLEITEDSWFQTDYEPSCGYQSDDKIYLDDVNAAFDSIEVSPLYGSKTQFRNFI